MNRAYKKLDNLNTYSVNRENKFCCKTYLFFLLKNSILIRNFKIGTNSNTSSDHSHHKCTLYSGGI